MSVMDGFIREFAIAVIFVPQTRTSAPAPVSAQTQAHNQSTTGQVVLTNLQANKTITRQNANGTWSFVIPRAFGEGTIVGGTKEPHDWDARARPASTETLVASALKDLGALDENDQKTSCSRPVTVVKEVVGRRPAREGGVRLEIEERASPRQETDHGTKNKFEENSTMTIVHAYGAGGRGYEISWGIADEVCGLVEQVMHRRRREHLREKENVSVRARARL